MKRRVYEHVVKEQPREDTILVPKAKPLQQEEVDLIEIHRSLTQHWRNNAIIEDTEDLVNLGFPPILRGLSADGTPDDGRLTTQFSRLLEIVEPTLFPDELLQTDFTHVTSTDHMVIDAPDGKNAMHKIDAVMEREAKYANNGDQQMDEKKDDRDMEYDNTFPEHEDNLGEDYDYTFCDEDDAL
ncbi:hypothetical protein X943_000334 [Babesia divergens]|uniref:Uncharacterized protein n=1 Tax=Babesia divergens TaxID=32595 RepID=A0AAD9G6F0_BABDI|nr:hypothetical protein X943_000334 [Babesia divergens]